MDKDFQDFICDAGNLVATCGFCGRTHFATHDEGCYDAGEIESYREKRDKEPSKYKEWDTSSISVGECAGTLVVWGCPCEKIKRYENFVWNHRDAILKFLKARSLANKRAADADAKAVEA